MCSTKINNDQSGDSTLGAEIEAKIQDDYHPAATARGFSNQSISNTKLKIQV